MEIRVILHYALLACILLGMPSSASAASLQKAPNNLGLVGYWSFNETSGTVAADYSGNGNMGTLTNGPVWAGGKLGGALRFDGTNDYVDAGAMDSIDAASAATIAFWGYRDSATKALHVSKGPGSVNWFALNVGGDGFLYLNVRTLTSSYRTPAYSGVGWHYYVMTFDGSQTGDAKLKAYVDGVSLSFTDNGTGAIPSTLTSSGSLHIGHDTPGAAYSNGIIDEVRIYSRALGASEVAALYGAGASKIYKTGAIRNFNPLGQTTRYWYCMAAAPNGDVYSCDVNTDILKKTSGTNTFVRLNQAALGWYAMTAAPNGNIYAAVTGGDIYMQTGGTGNFVALGQTSRAWRGMAAAPNGNIYAPVNGGDIYMQTAGTGNFNALGQTSREWVAMAAAPNGNVYAAVSGGDIYMQTGGTGNFVALGQTNRNWWGMTATRNGDVYAAVDQGDIYMQAGGTGNFVALGQSSQQWRGMAAAPNGDVYVGHQYGDIWMRSAGNAKINSTQKYQLTSGLVGYWTFNGQDTSWTSATAGTVRDVSGNGNTGTLTNMSRDFNPVAGKIGQGMSFDGTNDYVGIPYSSTHSFGTNNFTLSAWIKGSAFGSNNRILSNYRAEVDGRRGYIFSVNSGILTGYIGSGTPNLTSSTTLQAGTWYHVVMVREGDVARLYINGVTDGSPAAGMAAKNATSDGTLDISADTENSWFFNGSIDDVRIYNRALSAAEVKQLYNLGK